MRRAALLTIAIGAWLAWGIQSAGAQQLVQFPGPGQNFTQPFYVAAPPGDQHRVLVVEARGTIQLVKDGVTQPAPFLDVSADVLDLNEGGCECGMFSMAFDPDYASNGLFYVFYTRDDPTAGNNHYLRIEEFRRSAGNPDIADVATRRIVLEIPHLEASNHNGGQLQFGPDGYLYISTGDGGSTPERGQDRTTLLGKILRIDPHDPPGGAQYSVPVDNPFFGGEGGYLPEIYSFGLRNPYRFSFDRLTGDLAIGDVGDGSWEEADLVANGVGRGANFGWRCYEGTHVHTTTSECSPLPSDVTMPVLEYPHAGAAAISGGYVVRDTNVPTLLGRYLYADTYNSLSGEIYSAPATPGTMTTGESTGLATASVVSFGEDACAHVYVASINGPVYRIQPSTDAPACAPQQPAVTAPPPCTGPACSPDTSGPVISLDVGKARRAADRGAVTLLLSCDEDCRLEGTGRIALPGKDIGLDSDGGSLAAGALGALDLGLSEKEVERLRRALSDGRKAKAKIQLTGSDAAGNGSIVRRTVKQRP